MSTKTKTDDRSKRAEAIFFGLFVAGVIRIVWAYLKGGKSDRCCWHHAYMFSSGLVYLLVGLLQTILKELDYE